MYRQTYDTNDDNDDDDDDDDNNNDDEFGSTFARQTAEMVQASSFIGAA